jgi:uncharacterized Zn finger protein
MHTPGELTADLIRSAADTKTWQRGTGYHNDGRVVSVEQRNGWVHGKVAGSYRYRCKLRVADGDLAFACDCPVGGDHVLCKHVVATALTYLDRYGPSHTPPAKTKGRKVETTLADVQHYLESLEAGALVELVMDRLDQDDDWRAALLRTAAMHRPDGVDLDALKKAVTTATRTGPFLDYHESIGFASGLSSLCDSQAELIDAGHADAAIGLIEYVLKRCEDALGRMDDSSGCMSEVFDSLQTHHLRACQLAERLSPKKLAKRLFDWQMTTEYDTFYNAPETYAEVLGEDGLARFRELVQKRWDKLPDRQPGDDRIHFERDRFRLQSMMESLARANGDMDELILIKQKDLSSPYGFQQIAALCQESGQLDEAIDWAERGTKAFPDEQRDTRLHILLADLYQQAGRYDNAVELAWSLYDRCPVLDGYILLKQHAEQFRVNGRKSKKPWKQWRERALSRLRADIKQVAKDKPPRPDRDRFISAADSDHSRLVEVFLREETPDAAWQEAQTGGCTDELWLNLARRRETKHPADAVAVYQELAARCIERTNKRGYEEAIVLIERLLPLMTEAGMGGQSPRYLQVLCETYKRKRKFIQMLDALTYPGKG